MWFKSAYQRLPVPFLAAMAYFGYRYVLRLGFFDGGVGFQYWFLHATHLYCIDLKTREYRQTGMAPAVLWPSRGEPDPEVAASELQRLVDGGERVGSRSDLESDGASASV